ncbi:hypothetical protein BaRGS_00005016 [Batillaria attramentaria]|uniref:Uncharacterized protein n=1 Tax=Batillaria attramentaria TaxID=370345 RepID=A0ABD0LXS5_9CAEN
MNDLRSKVQQKFPNILPEIYFIPPANVHPAYGYQDSQDNFAQNHLIFNLQTLAEQQREVMFVVSKLNFHQYLAHSLYMKDVKPLPKPTDKCVDPTLRQGDFDLIIFHRYFGILVGEMKEVGLRNPRKPHITKRVNYTIKQLNKSELIMQHLISDIQPELIIRKAPIFPYITRSQLQATLDRNPTLKQELTKCVGAVDGAHASQLCLCSDELSDRKAPWHIQPAALESLNRWFLKRMGGSLDSHMTSSIYLELIARFAVATTVDPTNRRRKPCKSRNSRVRKKTEMVRSRQENAGPQHHKQASTVHGPQQTTNKDDYRPEQYSRNK